MFGQKFLVLVMLGLSISATADFRTVTEAYEVDLRDMRLPGNEYGTLTFKRCGACDAETVRVTGTTRYQINNRDVTLSEFKEQLKSVTIRKFQHAAVMHHLESNTIEAIKVRL